MLLRKNVAAVTTPATERDVTMSVTLEKKLGVEKAKMKAKEKGK